MASNNDSRVYMGVIKDVIRKVRDEFINCGAGEAVLSHIQSLWEMKMMQMQIGAISGNTEGSSSSSSTASRLVNPVHDLNVPYVGPTEEYEMLFPPTPLQTPFQTQDFFTSSTSTGKRKRDEYPSHLPSGSYTYVPQQDDGSDVIIEFEKGNSSSQVDQQGNESSSIPQHDAIDDEYDYLFQYPSVPAEDYTNIVVQTPAEHELRVPTPPAAVGKPRPTNNASADDGDSDENNGGRDLDEEEPTAQHLVLAQFVKVTYTKKTKIRKCTLKDGIMLLNNRDILFNEAMGEFDFYFCGSP